MGHLRHEDHGQAMALTRGMLALHSTTTNVITILYPKQDHIISLAPWSYFLNIVRSHFSRGANTYKKSLMNLLQHYKKCRQINRHQNRSGTHQPLCLKEYAQAEGVLAGFGVDS
jgi:hypothetical protein